MSLGTTKNIQRMCGPVRSVSGCPAFALIEAAFEIETAPWTGWSAPGSGVARYERGGAGQGPHSLHSAVFVGGKISPFSKGRAGGQARLLAPQTRRKPRRDRGGSASARRRRLLGDHLTV